MYFIFSKKINRKTAKFLQKTCSFGTLFYQFCVRFVYNLKLV